MQHDMMKEQLTSHLWTQFVVVMLGLWLMVSPPILGYLDETGIAASDVLSGALLVALGAIGLRAERGWARWTATGVGVWLLFAPLIFWSRSPAAYANDTIVAMLVVALTILIPGMPGMRMMRGPTVPPGWSYNPSSWQQRAPVLGLVFVSFLAARYLAAFQMEHLTSIWDPFFGAGTARVLTSDVSKAFPISDAGLGATTYALEFLSTFMGGTDRWRTMPWMVLLFGVLVVPLGIASIILVILQPVMVGEWCALCLFTALTMLVMIPFAVDEVVAMLQFMSDVRRRGDSLWDAFWRGGTMAGGEEEDERTPAFPSEARVLVRSSAWGLTLPWNLAAVAAAGLVIMALPAVAGLPRDVSVHLWITGPLITTFAVIASAEVIRSARFVGIGLALWLAVAVLLLGPASATVAGVAAAAIVIALSWPRGPIRERYAGWTERVV